MNNIEELSQRILFEDNHLIIVNKRVGEIVQGDKTGDEPLSELVKRYIKVTRNKPGDVYLGVTHRIDRPTSGLVVFAKTSKALSRMNLMFQEREIKKYYWAIVKIDPPSDEGTLTHYLKKNQTKNKAIIFKRPEPGAKKAVLHYRVISRSENYLLLEVDLETGRHHQIRAQLSAIGCPIKGDLKYGFPRSNPDAGISLHARGVNFTHPVSGEVIDLVAPLPKDALWSALERNVE
ncbi:MAG: RNA pseudouridine synthase [Bacteroidota bacterium]|nr:RNA pseudouridine synthase [Bacteroidota bacterium]MDX5447296.1 RNA pseudouridine synthase [Bacteroidota bacterium]MDX5505202.1 RNA pseudouridine synthase [Bacteroidota bacterium]